MFGKSILTLSLLTLLPYPSESQTRRVPAEWETHTATWMQWPSLWEAEMRPEFAAIIDVIQGYEPVHLITGSSGEKAEAEWFLASRGISSENITWHIIPMDNSWMRDNGPIYVTDGTETWVQNWRFDAWGGNFGGQIPFAKDDAVPVSVAKYLGLTVEGRQDYVLEKGNLEFNGVGTLVLNWDCQNDRNPGLSREEHEAILTQAFGLSRIIWAYGHYPSDGTTGHIDGIARFVDHDTIAIADYGTSIEKDLAAACAAAGLEVVWYPGDPNWLVGNGFVAAMADREASHTAKLAAQLETLFPGRDIHMIKASRIAESGGGIHCVTNDQPLTDAGRFADGFEAGNTNAWSLR